MKIKTWALIVAGLMLLAVVLLLTFINRTVNYGSPRSENVTRPLPPGSMSLEVSDNTGTAYTVGQNIPVAIMVDTAGININGVDCIIKYYNRDLQISGLTGSPAFDLYPVKAVTNFAIEISGLMQLGTTTTGVLKLGSFQATPLHSGTVKLELYFVPFATTDSNVVEAKNSTDILGRVSDLTFTVK